MGKGEVEALHDTYCAGYHNLPRMVKRHLSLHDMQEIWFHMVRPVVDTLTAELESLKQQVPMSEALLKNAYKLGWLAACAWADREDMEYDTESPAYIRRRDAVLADVDKALPPEPQEKDQ